MSSTATIDTALPETYTKPREEMKTQPRRFLRDIASGQENAGQDTTTLEDFSVLAKLRESEEA